MKRTARDIAEEAHQDQMYGDMSYMHHIHMVHSNVMDYYLRDPDIRLLVDLAYLHDVVEDTSMTLEDVRKELGKYNHIDYLIDALDAITHRKNEPRLEYIERCKVDPLARKVKIADTMANLESSIITKDVRRIRKYSKQIELLHAE